MRVFGRDSGRVSRSTQRRSAKETSVKGGTSKMVKPGDVVYVRPSVPHYVSEIRDHVMEILVRWDVK
jgi:hypothetical protein